MTVGRSAPKPCTVDLRQLVERFAARARSNHDALRELDVVVAQVRILNNNVFARYAASCAMADITNGEPRLERFESRCVELAAAVLWHGSWYQAVLIPSCCACREACRDNVST